VSNTTGFVLTQSQGSLNVALVDRRGVARWLLMSTTRL